MNLVPRKKKDNSTKQPAPKKTRMTLGAFLTDELPSVLDVVSFSGNLPMSIYADATVVKSPEVVFRGLVLSQNRLAAEEYLLNFKRSEADLGVVIGANNYLNPMVVGTLANRGLEENENDLIALPPYDNVRTGISALIRSRRSIRRYSGKSFSLKDLSTLLYHAAGVSGHLHPDVTSETVTLGKNDQIELRAAVSGGALYPIDLFVLPINIDGLDAGRAYRYLPSGHALEPIDSTGPSPALSQLAQFGPIQVEQAGFLIGYVYKVFENARKYGDAALAFALIETGAIAAHVHLLCTALGFGSCDVGSFSKVRFERLFDADGMSRHMIHLTVVGKSGEE